MATTNDPRAAGFNAAEVREALRFAMNMGLPEDTAERITFRWSVKSTFGTPDPSGNPYDFTSTPATTVAKSDVQIPAAVEFMASGSFVSESGTVFGSFTTPSAVITVLDEDYPQIEGADLALLGGNEYRIVYVAPPVGLFGMTVYMLHCRAKDES